MPVPSGSVCGRATPADSSMEIPVFRPGRVATGGMDWPPGGALAGGPTNVSLGVLLAEPGIVGIPHPAKRITHAPLVGLSIRVTTIPRSPSAVVALDFASARLYPLRQHKLLESWQWASRCSWAGRGWAGK